MLQRVFDIDMQHGPNYGAGEFKVIASILERAVLERNLAHLGLDPQPPPTAPARGGSIKLAELSRIPSPNTHTPPWQPAAQRDGSETRALAVLGAERARRSRHQGEPSAGGRRQVCGACQGRVRARWRRAVPRLARWCANVKALLGVQGKVGPGCASR